MQVLSAPPALSEESPELLGRIKCWDCAQELGEHASDDMGSKWQTHAKASRHSAVMWSKV